MINITATTYNNYQPGSTYNFASKALPVNTDPIKNTNLTLNPVVKNDSANQPIQEQTNQDTESLDPNNPEQKNTLDAQVENNSQLSQAELQLVEELKKIDTEVRRHEMAHIAAGGQFITSGANFTYKQGPDGKNYVIGGEVGIDTSPVPGDPEATIRKMRQIKNAALAPANPSAQDLKVASKAASESSQALSDLMILQAQEQADSNEKEAFGNVKKAAASYETVNNLPEEDTSTFQIAV